MIEKKIAGLLGLAAKSGNLASGEYMTHESIKKGKAYLVIAATDASENTRKKFKNSCSFYEVPFVVYASREELGEAIGKEFRASLAITDEGFATAVMKKMNQEEIIIYGKNEDFGNN